MTRAGINLPHEGACARPPVFVCGLGRSGTTWVATALGQSPELVYVREAWLLARLHDLVQWHDTIHDDWSQFTPWKDAGVDRRAFIEEVGRFYGSLLDRAASGRRFVEKTPEWNVLYLRLLGELFPDAYYVLIHRDGRNYVASSKAKRERDREEFDFETWCRRWAHATDVLDEANAGSWLRRRRLVRYEDLLTRFDEEFDALCRFVEIAPFRPRPHRPNSAFSDVSAGAFNRRWGGWSAGEKGIFKRIAGDRLERWGYVPDSSW